MRFHLFEFEDLPWLPAVVRNGMTDFLQFLLKIFDFYQPTATLIKELMEQTDDTQVLDLCSGGGGYASQLQRHLSKMMGKEVRVVLSDKYPNSVKYKYLKENSQGHLDYIEKSVDATAVLKNVGGGIRTMYSAAHHFKPETLKAILNATVKSKSGIAIFDAGNKNPLIIFAILLLFPILFLCCTPFIKPFKWSRLFLTYVIPLIPLLTIWDGSVSILRIYCPLQLAKVASELPDSSYIWKTGHIYTKLGLKITYLTGYPLKES